MPKRLVVEVGSGFNPLPLLLLGAEHYLVDPKFERGDISPETGATTIAALGQQVDKYFAPGTVTAIVMRNVVCDPTYAPFIDDNAASLIKALSVVLAPEGLLLSIDDDACLGGLYETVSSLSSGDARRFAGLYFEETVLPDLFKTDCHPKANVLVGTVESVQLGKYALWQEICAQPQPAQTNIAAPQSTSDRKGLAAALQRFFRVV